jgi:phospholipid/cholesterol/gamma-HCH transport system substrate-binding protein
MTAARRERLIRIASGLIAVVLASAAAVFGVRVATGALAPTYEVDAAFSSAGQGLLKGSDVKVHGVNVGNVKSVHLLDGKAFVRMDIDSGQKLPAASRAIIRPKTLFGEKFVDVDPGQGEVSGPFLHNHGRIVDTLGGFDLERVLSSAYPVLKAVKPEELTTVLDSLAQSAQGEAPAISRQIDNFLSLTNVQVAHDADTQRFLADFALLSEELDARSGAIVQAAQALNDTLPVVNSRSASLGSLLDQSARLSSDLADLFTANHSFFVKGITEGGQVVQTLYDRQREIVPLVIGIRQYLEIQAEVVRIPAPDGTMLGAVEFTAGEDCVTGRVPGCPTASAPTAAAGRPSAGSPSKPGSALPLPSLPPLPLPGLAAPQSVTQGLLSLLQGL